MTSTSLDDVKALRYFGATDPPFEQVAFTYLLFTSNDTIAYIANKDYLISNLIVIGRYLFIQSNKKGKLKFCISHLNFYITFYYLLQQQTLSHYYNLTAEVILIFCLRSTFCTKCRNKANIIKCFLPSSPFSTPTLNFCFLFDILFHKIHPPPFPSLNQPFKIKCWILVF